MKTVKGFFTASDGTQIRYYLWGEGHPVVFPHGYGGGCASIVRDAPLLGEEYQIISFDQRGYGDSPLTENAGLLRSAQDMKELIEFLGHREVDAVCYSMGGAVFYAYARQFGMKHIRGVVIGDAPPKLINESDWQWGLYQGHFTREEWEANCCPPDEATAVAQNVYFAQQIMTPHHPEEERHPLDPVKDAGMIAAILAYTKSFGVEIYDPEVAKTNLCYLRSLGENDFREDLTKITAPALIVFADPGSIYMPEAGHYIASRLPDARLKIVPNAGHGLNDDQRADYYQTIRRFFSEG